MEYGKMIRQARQTLGLTIRELAKLDISPELLGNIELGKSKLTCKKALVLYKNILVYSWELGVFPEINFDELMVDNEVYHTTKQVHEFCLSLRREGAKGRSLSASDYEKGMAIVHQSDLGMLRYHVMKQMASLAKVSKPDWYLEIQYGVLNDLRWSNLNEHYEKYRQCLYSITGLAYQKGHFLDLIKYYEILLKGQQAYDKAKEVIVYFNLSLFNYLIGRYGTALDYLEDYIAFQDLSEEDMVDVLIMKSNICYAKGELGQALEITLEGYEKAKQCGLKMRRTNCLSNFILWSCEHGNPFRYDIRKGIDEVLSDLNCYNFDIVQLGAHYSNIGRAYGYLGLYDVSKAYFTKAFDSATNDTNLIIRMTEAAEVYHLSKSYYDLVDRILTIQTKTLNSLDKVKLYELVVNLVALGDLDSRHEINKVMRNILVSI